MTRRTDPRTTRLPVKAEQIPDFTPVTRETSRHDGWTEHRQRAFIEALADTGSVHAACKAVDMSQGGAYYLRRQPNAQSFRAAWQAALDLGVQKIEDVAMDRALNGVQVPIVSYGKLVGERTIHNDRLLMFMLRNRAPERFGGQLNGGTAKDMNAIGKMELERKKKEWRAQNREEWEAEQNNVSPTEIRDSIERKVQALREQVHARQSSEWDSLTQETRDAWLKFETLKARDLGREVELPSMFRLENR